MIDNRHSTHTHTHTHARTHTHTPYTQDEIPACEIRPRVDDVKNSPRRFINAARVLPPRTRNNNTVSVLYVYVVCLYVCMSACTHTQAADPSGAAAAAKPSRNSHAAAELSPVVKSAARSSRAAKVASRLSASAPSSTAGKASHASACATKPSRASSRVSKKSSRASRAAAKSSRATAKSSLKSRAAASSTGKSSAAAAASTNKSRSAAAPARKPRAVAKHSHKPRAVGKPSHDDSPDPVCVFVGERVQVFWPCEGQWFTGVVDEVDESDGTYKVCYVIDGEEHWHGSDMEVRSQEEMLNESMVFY